MTVSAPSVEDAAGLEGHALASVGELVKFTPYVKLRGNVVEEVLAVAVSAAVRAREKVSIGGDCATTARRRAFSVTARMWPSSRRSCRRRERRASGRCRARGRRPSLG